MEFLFGFDLLFFSALAEKPSPKVYPSYKCTLKHLTNVL